MEFNFGGNVIKSINEYSELSKYFPYGITEQKGFYVYITERFIRDVKEYLIKDLSDIKKRQRIIDTIQITLNENTNGDINNEGTQCWHNKNGYGREGKIGHFFNNDYVIRIAYTFESGVFIINNLYNHRYGNSVEDAAKNNSKKIIGEIKRDNNFSWDKLKYKIVPDKTIELNKLLQSYDLNDEEQEVCLSYKYKDLDEIESAIKKYLSEKENKINELKNIFGDDTISTEEFDSLKKDELLKYLENIILGEKYQYKLGKEYLSEARQTTALKSNGVYSVMNDTWIKEPVSEDIPEINQEEFNKVFNEWESKYFNIVGEYSSEDELFEKLTKKLLYCYEGPIYKFGRYMKDVYLETKAVSLPQAINNFKYQAAKAIGYNRATGTNVNIRDELVQCLGDTNSSNSEEAAPIQRTLCPKCRKAYLNYVGECPICDLNDEDLLYESFDYDLQSKIEEIDDFIEDIYDLRKTSIKDEGEYGIGNLVFKEFRNKGYLDNLKEIKYKLLSKKLSLN